MKSKTSRLIELVNDKTLLREAPLVRDLIVELYNYDIDDPNNKRKHTEIKGEHPAYNRRKIIRKFASLVRNLREKSGPGLYENPKYDFRIVRDENNVRRVVHIKEGVNEDYILQKKVRYGKRMRIEDWEEEVEYQQKTMYLVGTTEEAVDKANSWADSHIKCKKAMLMKNYCKRKHIKMAIKELKHSWVQTKLTDIFSFNSNSSSTEGFEAKAALGEKITERSKYRPNYRGIQHMFEQNALELFFEEAYDKNETWSLKMILTRDTKTKKCGNICDRVEQAQLERKVMKTLLKQIILCDYQLKHFNRPGRDEEKVKAAIKRFRDLKIDSWVTVTTRSREAHYAQFKGR